MKYYIHYEGGIAIEAKTAEEAENIFWEKHAEGNLSDTIISVNH